MTASQIDTTYTALANAIARSHAQGPGKAELFLATLALSLLTTQADDAACQKLITQAEQLAAS
jgi:hypothetical protein